MCEEKKYEWSIGELNFDKLTRNICSEKHLNEFKAWCFDNCSFRFTSRLAGTDSETGIELLAELHKPEREHWTEYALKEGFIREVEEIYRIGDVIEITRASLNVYEKYIINLSGTDSFCLNKVDGGCLCYSMRVENVFLITRSELSQHLGCLITSFKKIGHGAKDLI